ncbi:MAG: transporter substrate-binding domain-containing protein [Acholeplasmatales bacterium]|nr:transporter substrate-binding domain-containing protein [Acholeplasmatales bacterium]
MKKLLTVLLTLVLTISCAISLAACGKKAKLKVIETSLTAESYAYAVKKDNAELLASVNELLADMKADGSLDTLINSYFNGNATFKYTNPTSKTGCLIVATNAYFPPFEYYEGSDITGVDMEIAYKLAQKLGKTLYIDNMEFSSVLASVQSGIADIAMAGITVTEARKEMYAFSTEYYESAQVLITTEKNTEFDGKTASEIEAILKEKKSSYTIGTQKGTTGYMYSAGDEDFGYDGFTNLKTVAYSNGALACTDLKNGKIDAVIIDLQPALMITKNINGDK